MGGYIYEVEFVDCREGLFCKKRFNGEGYGGCGCEYVRVGVGV